MLRLFNSCAGKRAVKMKCSRLVSSLACAVWIGHLPYLAQAGSGAQPLADADQAAWSAIGQISYGEKTDGAICTATLVAPDLVLTAGHCVAVDGVAIRAGTIKFSAGKRGAESVAVRYGTEIILLSPPAGEPWRMRHDIALVVLDKPIEANDAVPLPLAQQTEIAGRYSFIGYRRAARDFALRDDDCTVLDKRMTVLSLSCSVVSGNSGSPLLTQKDGVWQVSGVIVSDGTGKGGINAYAIIPGDDFRSRIGIAG